MVTGWGSILYGPLLAMYKVDLHDFVSFNSHSATISRLDYFVHRPSGYLQVADFFTIVVPKTRLSGPLENVFNLFCRLQDKRTVGLDWRRSFGENQLTRCCRGPRPVVCGCTTRTTRTPRTPRTTRTTRTKGGKAPFHLFLMWIGHGPRGGATLLPSRPRHIMRARMIRLKRRSKHVLAAKHIIPALPLVRILFLTQGKHVALHLTVHSQSDPSGFTQTRALNR